MDEDQRIKEFLNKLANAVIHAIRGGLKADRDRLVAALRQMNEEMPDSSAEAAQVEEFHSALISLLEGHPVGPETLKEPYRAIYARVVDKALSTGKTAEPGDDGMREFLTQLAATVVVVMRDGADEDKKGLSARLREVQADLPDGSMDAGQFVLALVSVLEGMPVMPEALPEPYSHTYRKILAIIDSSSR